MNALHTTHASFVKKYLQRKGQQQKRVDAARQQKKNPPPAQNLIFEVWPLEPAYARAIARIVDDLDGVRDAGESAAGARPRFAC